MLPGAADDALPRAMPLPALPGALPRSTRRRSTLVLTVAGGEADVLLTPRELVERRKRYSLSGASHESPRNRQGSVASLSSSWTRPSPSSNAAAAAAAGGGERL
jgi:hypothetical protein